QSNEQLFDVRLVVTGPSGRHVVRAGRRRSAYGLSWPTRGGGGSRIPEGRYHLRFQARDLAGNRVDVDAGAVTLRYLPIVDPRRSLQGGQRIRLDTDAGSVRWRLVPLVVAASNGTGPQPGGMLGGAPRSLTLPRGLRGGLYRLTVRILSGHQASLLLAI